MKRGANGTGETTYLLYLTHELKETIKAAAVARGLTVSTWWKEAAQRALKLESRRKKP
jgi:hypothetical protein